MTAHPLEVSNRYQITRKTAPGKMTCHKASPTHAPPTVAMALPPLNPKNGENACPNDGANAIRIRGRPSILKTCAANPTGKAALPISSITARIPHWMPPARKTLNAPGLPSPKLRISFCTPNLPIHTAKGNDPQKKAKIRSSNSPMVMKAYFSDTYGSI